jgi:aryl-alcohol dehydrogenase-like predicted oxidoreductase
MSTPADTRLHDAGLPLPTRSLGRDGPEISVLGLGTWAIGGGGWSFGWGPQDDEQSLRTMRRALDAGITWFDTAAIYGLGHSEEVVGRFLAGLPAADRPLVFTKGGLVWDPADRRKDPRRDLSPANMRRECEGSLRRLRVERIDLYQLHWPDLSGMAVEESWAEMARLIDEGKVRWGGVSNFDVGLLDRCEALRHVDSMQPPLSLISRDAAAEVVPWAQRHGTGVICYSPMESGLLTDGFSARRCDEMAADDWRRREPGFRGEALARNMALRDALQPVARRHGVPVAAVAVAWTLCWPGVTAAICGARRPEQIDGWIAAAALRLTAADLDEIAAAVEFTGAGSGPARPT